MLLVHPLGCDVICIREVLLTFRWNLLFPFAIHKIKIVENVLRDIEKVLELYESLWDVWPWKGEWRWRGAGRQSEMQDRATANVIDSDKGLLLATLSTTCRGRRGKALYIYTDNFGTRPSCKVRFTPRVLTSLKLPRCPLNRRLVGPQSQCTVLENSKSCSYCRDWTADCRKLQPVGILIALSWQ